MASIFDVAKYILNAKGEITSWELQKLCYYCKAWSLALGEGEMFPEKFEAWKDGPACRSLFAEHRGNFNVTLMDIRKGDRDNLSPNSIDVINAVIDAYKDMDGMDLRKQTHGEAPWRIARNGLPEFAPCDNEINEDVMRDFYRHSDKFDLIDDLVLEHKALRRMAANSKTYTFAEVMEHLGITAEDIENAEDVEIEIEPCYASKR